MSKRAKTLNRMIGHTVKAHRASISMTLPALARSSQLSKGLLSKLENGKGNPTIDTLCRIATAFACSVEDIISGEIIPF